MFNNNLGLSVILSFQCMIFSGPLFANDHPLIEKSEILQPRQQPSIVLQKPTFSQQSMIPELDLHPTTPEEAYKVLGLAANQRTQTDIRKAFFDLAMKYTLKKDGLALERLKNINHAHKILKGITIPTQLNLSIS